jgi:aspartyl-tRNA(Asn)/glutamyl-tRNA(Gln) amidotransferase subunit C
MCTAGEPHGSPALFSYASRMSGQKSELSAAEVQKVAHLARLKLTPAQVEDYRVKLGAVIGYVDRLRELDLEDAEPMTTPFESSNRFAPDEPEASLPVEDVMRLAPHSNPPFIVVPKVLGDGGGG